MSGDNVITVNEVGKAYRIWSDPASRMISPLLEFCGRFLPAEDWWRKRAAARYHDFHALHGISLAIGKGEAVGIIGRNGSGKSTLLQIISGTMQPSTGTVEIRGRIAALLELGSGFNPEFSGRENVYLNGAVLGLSRQEMDRRFADISAFADIGDFIEQPVRTYSSGMVVRLAFAVAANVDPDILIVDEALSVGDARFQLKCARAIDAFIQRGVTLLFVSHDASMIKRLCNRAVLLDKGRILYGGLPNDVVNLYSKLIADGGSAETIAGDIATLQMNSGGGPNPSIRRSSQPASPHPAFTSPKNNTGETSTEVTQLLMRIKALETILEARPDSDGLQKRLEELWQDERRHVQLTGREFAYGGDLGRITDVTIEDRDAQPRTWFISGEPVTVRMVVESDEALAEPIYALTIKSAAGLEVYGTNTLFGNQPPGPLGAGERREISFSFDLNVMPGHYFISLGFTHYVGDDLVVIHRRYDVIKLDIHGIDRCFGIANLHARIAIRDVVQPSPHSNQA